MVELIGSSSDPAIPAVAGTHTTGGPGVKAESHDGPGLSAHSDTHDGVRAESSATGSAWSGVRGVHHGKGPGVYGSSAEGQGILGLSDKGAGVQGVSGGGDAVHGETDSMDPRHSGVFGNNVGGGAGVRGMALGTAPAVTGEQRSGGPGVLGVSTSSAGVRGVASGSSGVLGESDSPGTYDSGVLGANHGGGPGVRGVAVGSSAGVLGEQHEKGPGVVGSSEENAGVLGWGQNGPAVVGSSMANHGVVGYSALVGGAGVFGQNDAGVGLWGRTAGNLFATYGENLGSGHGVRGVARGEGPGVSGVSVSGSGVVGESLKRGWIGVEGRAQDGLGVLGRTDGGLWGAGVAGVNDGDGPGVLGGKDNERGIGVLGRTTFKYYFNMAGPSAGVFGMSGNGSGGLFGNAAQYPALEGFNSSTSGPSTGVNGIVKSPAGNAIQGTNYAGGYAGAFFGNVGVVGNMGVTGSLTAGAKSFRIDHPLDPLNSYLTHSCVESPDMLTMYSGTVVTHADGEAVVELPDYFEALNTDFHYQLTVVGGEFAQAVIRREISENAFTIATSSPDVKVCWQVTGVRDDAYARGHRAPVRQQKPSGERGQYLHPAAFGATQAVVGMSPAPSALDVESDTHTSQDAPPWAVARERSDSPNLEIGPDPVTILGDLGTDILATRPLNQR